MVPTYCDTSCMRAKCCATWDQGAPYFSCVTLKPGCRAGDVTATAREGQEPRWSSFTWSMKACYVSQHH